MIRSKIIPPYEERLRRAITEEIRLNMEIKGVGMNKLARLIDRKPWMLQQQLAQAHNTMTMGSIARIADALGMVAVLEFKDKS